MLLEETEGKIREKKLKTYHHSLPWRSFSHVAEAVSTMVTGVTDTSMLRKKDWMKTCTEGFHDTLIHTNCY